MNKIVVVGLGPAGADMVTARAHDELNSGKTVFLRTTRHPAASVAGSAQSFDSVYESSSSIDDVYPEIVRQLLGAATDGDVVYAVPGSPTVAEHTVELLRESNVEVEIVPAMSFLELCWDRLAIDPFAVSPRIVDGHRFAIESAGERGPLLVGQCDSQSVLSDIKLAFGEANPDVTVLQRLGLPDEKVFTISVVELDREVTADHLTSIYIPEFESPINQALATVVETVRRLRNECPWDKEQTHLTLANHMLEEAYEAAEAMGNSKDYENADHLIEELGDVLVQVLMNAAVAEQAGEFDISDIATMLNEKLIRRHPHIFADVVAETPDQVMANWSDIKKSEGRTEKGPKGETFPSLMYSREIYEYFENEGLANPGIEWKFKDVAEELDEAREAWTNDNELSPHVYEELGDMLWSAVRLCEALGADAEAVLRAACGRYLDRFGRARQAVEADGKALTDLDFEAQYVYWKKAKA